MTTLELVIAGLALIWGPLPDCGAECPATVYFPEGHGPQYVCGQDLKDKHQLALVFDIDDLDNAQGGTFRTYRKDGKEIAIEPICHDITINAEGLGSTVKKHKQNEGCDPGDFDPSSYACVVNVKDISPDLSLHGGAAVLRELTIPGGTLKARGIAMKDAGNGTRQAIPWDLPNDHREPKAIANTVVLESETISGPVSITGTDCNGDDMVLTFKQKDLLLDISNLPTRPTGPGDSEYTRLEHLRWHYPHLIDDNEPDCSDWGLIRADVPPGDIIVDVGSADVFCPPGDGP